MVEVLSTRLTYKAADFCVLDTGSVLIVRDDLPSITILKASAPLT